jgi:hypothetical protein
VHDWIANRLTRDARFIHRMWSMRIALLGAIISGLYCALPAFQNHFSPAHFALLCIGFSLAVFFCSLVKQKDVPE